MVSYVRVVVAGSPGKDIIVSAKCGRKAPGMPFRPPGAFLFAFYLWRKASSMAALITEKSSSPNDSLM